MHRLKVGWPSPAMVVALIALFVALGGGAYATLGLPKSSVGTAQLKNGAVTRAKLRNNAVTTIKVKNHSLLPKDFKSGQVAAGTIPAASVFCARDNPCQPVISGTQTSLAFSGTAFDTDNLHAMADRLTAPISGIYVAAGDVVFPEDSEGLRTVAIGPLESCCDGVQQLGAGSVSGTTSTALSTSALVRLQAGDSLTLQVRQTSGGSMTPISATFSMSWVGPAG